MYDWSWEAVLGFEVPLERFSCCWKDVRLKLILDLTWRFRLFVSVVVERMYDWSIGGRKRNAGPCTFQLLLKGCTIEADYFTSCLPWPQKFQLLLKGCTIEASGEAVIMYSMASFSCCWKDVRLKRWGWLSSQRVLPCFSCCWKDVRLKLN